MITISEEKYLQLIKDSAELEILHTLGVDNWEQYSELNDFPDLCASLDQGQISVEQFLEKIWEV